MNWTRLTIILVAGSAAIIAIAAFVRQSQPQTLNAQEQTAQVELIDLDVRVEASGNIAPAREVPLEFGNTYVVREVLVEEGDTVRAGDVIATLDMEEYDILVDNARIDFERRDNSFNDIVAPPRDVDLIAAQAGVDAAEAEFWAAGQTAPTEEEVEIARLGVEVAKNDLWQGQLNRDITEQIGPEFRTTAGQNGFAQNIQENDRVNQLETGVDVAALEFEDIQDDGPDGNTFGASVESVANAEVNLDNTVNPDEFDVELSALNLHRAALNLERLEVQIVDMQIVAPFDGIIIENNLNVGELPPDGAAVIIADNTTFEVELEVDETDVVNLVRGMPVDITIDALPEANLAGSITTIDVLPLPEESVPTYRVSVTLDPSNEPIQSGMSADGEIVVTQLTDVPAVPTRYLETDADGTFVTVIEAGETRRVPVVTGRTSGIFTQIIDGLTPGQRIVLPETE